MNPQNLKDLDALTSYIFESEMENFDSCLREQPDDFPGLTPEELNDLESMDYGSADWSKLVNKAAMDPKNMHVYACAYRLWYSHLAKGEER